MSFSWNIPFMVIVPFTGPLLYQAFNLLLRRQKKNRLAGGGKSGKAAEKKRKKALAEALL
jgi:hypothetical protein